MTGRYPLVYMAAAALLAACSTEVAQYPSLAPRAVEKTGFAEPVVTAPAMVLPDPALDARVAQATAQLEVIGRSFEQAAAAATRLAAAAQGQAAGSERWIEAQTALAVLDDLRAQTSSVVTDLDGLAIERAARLAPAHTALDAARAQADALLDRQSSRIAALTASLAPA